jgi:hypothetical protein|tara:strand:- start:58 stop:195 length:138 start_codon:yes stop_codon:yes gene_type:complete
VEVLQSSVRIVGIALDVVEEVALVGFGKQVEALFRSLSESHPLSF